MVSFQGIRCLACDALTQHSQGMKGHRLIASLTHALPLMVAAVQVRFQCEGLYCSLFKVDANAAQPARWSQHVLHAMAARKTSALPSVWFCSVA